VFFYKNNKKCKKRFLHLRNFLCLKTSQCNLVQRLWKPCHSVNENLLIGSTCVCGPASCDSFQLESHCFGNWCNIFVRNEISTSYWPAQRHSSVYILKGRYLNVQLHTHTYNTHLKNVLKKEHCFLNVLPWICLGLHLSVRGQFSRADLIKPRNNNFSDTEIYSSVLI